MFATSLANGLRVLESFKVGQAALSNRELAERCGLSKASVSRLTYTLCALGFLKADLRERRYRLGSATLAAGYPLLGSLAIRQVARPFMQALANHARGSVSLGIRDRGNMVYVETWRGHEGIAFRPDIGGTMPMLATAIGRAWLAGVEPALRKATLTRLRSERPAEWKHCRAAVLASLEHSRCHGFSVAEGDWQPDVHAVGVALGVPIDNETLVFNCGVPALSLAPGALINDVGPCLVDMVRDIERAWRAECAAPRGVPPVLVRA